jgi:glutamate--cysteine ligase
MDQHANSTLYGSALAAQLAKVRNPNLTPSAKVVKALGESQSFFHFTMQRARQHADFFAGQPASRGSNARLSAEAHQSLIKQSQIEEADHLSFTDFVNDYLEL